MTVASHRQLRMPDATIDTTQITSANLDPRETPVVRAIRLARPSVINIHGQKTVPRTAAAMAGAAPGENSRSVNGMGTGVIIDPRGYAITNYHVVQDVENINVTMESGKTATATLIAARVKNDLALIKVHTDEPMLPIRRGRSDDLMVGERVIAIGNAFGYVHTTTQGIISALHRDVPVNDAQHYTDLIQISAGINPGNSGGPLLNIRGEIIGINVAVRVNAQQIAFAIPVGQVIDIVSEMIESENDSRLGLKFGAVGGPRDGAGVTVGMRTGNGGGTTIPGDEVIRVGTRTVDDRLDFALALIDHPPGEPLQLEVLRNGGSQRITMQAGRAVTDVRTLAWRYLGLRIRPVDSGKLNAMNAGRQAFQGGLYVSNVRRGSTADRHGIRRGDVLLGLQDWQTATLEELSIVLNMPEMRVGPKTKFVIQRDDLTLYGYMQLAARSAPTIR